MMMRYLRSLAGRLTLWYASIFSLCFLVVFGSFYLIMRNHFHFWTDEKLQEEIVEANVAYRAHGVESVILQFKQEEAAESGRFMGRLIDREGRVVFETVPRRWSQLPIDQKLLESARSGHDELELVQPCANHKARVIYSALPDGFVVQIGIGYRAHEIWMRQFSTDLLKVALLALALSVVAGGFMARRALSPIREMAQTTAGISGRSMGQRMPVSPRGDEVDQLAVSFNGMLERIDQLLEGLREVTDSVAHDLRTPITGIRGMVEVTLSARREPKEYRMALYEVLEQLDVLLNFFNTILEVAEAESGALILRLESLPMDDLVREVVQTFEPVAADRGISFESFVAPGLTIKGDRARLSQMLANLLDNSLKYTPNGGHVRLHAECDPGGKGAIITIADSGSGISEKDLPHIFERYYRGDKSRSGPGVGLGLPFVQGIVKAHGGSIAVESQPGLGALFRVSLPSCSKQGA
jgi:signal transduction histidine kinase